MSEHSRGPNPSEENPHTTLKRYPRSPSRPPNSPKQAPPAATPGQLHRHLPLTSSPGPAAPHAVKPEPASLLRQVLACTCETGSVWELRCSPQCFSHRRIWRASLAARSAGTKQIQRKIVKIKEILVGFPMRETRISVHGCQV